MVANVNTEKAVAADADVAAMVEPLVKALADALRARGWRIATAESCTGGLIAAACTELAGSSDWFERGFVTYSNAAKTELLGVDAALIVAHGAVSEPVALAMAQGALQRAPVQLAVAVTGIAGPGGAVPGKPVGTVWMALATWAYGVPAARAERLQLGGDRAAVRAAAVRQALRRLQEAAGDPPPATQGA
jgi:nicotinamide-nucleotide amidase